MGVHVLCQKACWIMQCLQGELLWPPFSDTYLATRCLFDGQGYLLLASVGVHFGHSRADCAFP